MTNKKKTASTPEAKKLKLEKETLRDLDAKNAKGVRGGMLYISGKGCDVSGAGCVVNKKEITATAAKDCI